MNLIDRLRRKGERIPIPCPDKIKGCLVSHFRLEADPECREAADAIEAQAKEIAELRAAALLAYNEMRNTVAPRNSFTDALDALDAALFPPGKAAS